VTLFQKVNGGSAGAAGLLKLDQEGTAVGKFFTIWIDGREFPSSPLQADVPPAPWLPILILR